MNERFSNACKKSFIVGVLPFRWLESLYLMFERDTALYKCVRARMVKHLRLDPRRKFSSKKTNVDIFNITSCQTI